MKQGLYANINAKRKRIEAGSGEKMNKAGSKKAPSAKDFKESAKTAKKKIMEKRFKKVVINPETGRKKTVRYGQKGATIKPGTSRATRIVRDRQRSRVTGSQIPTRQIV